MIEKIRTVTYEIRGHGENTIVSSEGKVLRSESGLETCLYLAKKGDVKKLIRHLQDILKCMKQIEKKREREKYLNRVELHLTGDYKKALDNIGKVVNPYPRLRGVKQ